MGRTKNRRNKRDAADDLAQEVRRDLTRQQLRARGWPPTTRIAPGKPVGKPPARPQASEEEASREPS